MAVVTRVRADSTDLESNSHSGSTGSTGSGAKLNIMETERLLASSSHHQHRAVPLSPGAAKRSFVYQLSNLQVRPYHPQQIID